MEIITTHTNSDFDCLGAMTAAARLYPDALLCFPGSQEKGVRDFIARHPEYLPAFTRAKEIDLSAVTRLVIVDCREAGRIGRFAGILGRPGLEVHVFDHHPETAESIKATGGVIRPCGSVSSIMALLLKERGFALTPEEATVIMLGIYEDTGRLLYLSTTTEDYLAAAWLLEQGARLNVVADFLAQELTSLQVELLNKLLKNLRTILIRNIPVSIASASTDTYVSDIAGLAHVIRDMENLDALFVALEMEGRTHLVARSRLPEVNAGELLKHFNGGGHATAASAMISDQSLKDVLKRLEELLLNTVKPSVTASEIMSSPVKTMPVNVSIAEARELLTRYNCNAMPIMDGPRMVGIISRKTVEKALYHNFGSAPVTDFMHTEFMRARKNTLLSDIQEYMVTGNRRFVPVFAGEDLVGAVTRTDLLRHMHGSEPKEFPVTNGYPGQAGTAPKSRNIAGIMTKRLPRPALDLLHSFGATGDQLGLPVYVVGGFVRDLLLGVENLDLDVTVEGDGIFFAEKFAELHDCRVRSHPVFGTAVLIFPDGSKVDVASTRLEFYESPGMLPTVERSSLRHDLYRRDFTINTLAISINEKSFGLLTDYYGGLQDIHENVIRVLHNLSFIEDPTRLFRAIRFEQRLGFHIAPHTENLMRTGIRMDMPSKVSGIRVLNELKIILQEKDPLSAINRMAQLGLSVKIHPALKLIPETTRVLNEAVRLMAWFRMLYLDDDCEQWLVYLLALCTGLSQNDFEQTCKKLFIPGRITENVFEQRRRVVIILDTLQQKLKRGLEIRNSEIYHSFKDLSVELLLYLAARANREEVRRFTASYMTHLRMINCSLDGNALKALGVPPGPEIGRIKEKLLNARLDGEIVTDQEELELAKRLVHGNGDAINTEKKEEEL